MAKLLFVTNEENLKIRQLFRACVAGPGIFNELEGKIYWDRTSLNFEAFQVGVAKIIGDATMARMMEEGIVEMVIVRKVPRGGRIVDNSLN